MQHIFIINPAAGKSDSRQKIYAMADALRKNHGLDVKCMLTQSPGHATALTRSIAETGEEVRFYACGGDGTVSEVVNGIAGFPNAAMTCIPVGTGNDFLKNFGADAALFADAENLWDQPTRQLDLIDCNGRAVLTIACSGVDARIASDVHKYSRLPLLSGKGSYIASIIWNFIFKGICDQWTVWLDEEEIRGDFALVAVCNGRYYGGGFMPIGDASMTDGQLDTLVIHKVSRLTFARLVGPYGKGRGTDFPKHVRRSDAKVIRIRAKEGHEVTTCMDGEIMRSPEVTIRLHEKKINFFGASSAQAAAEEPAQASLV